MTKETASNSTPNVGVVIAQDFEGSEGFLTEQLLPWITKSGLAIIDQGLISGSNFMVSILLARWLTPEQYGAYALAFGIFILLSLIYLALLLEPMAVFGGSTYRGCLKEYMGALLWLNIAVGALIFFLLGSSAAIAWRVDPGGVLAGALAGVTLAAPCLFFFWLVRRAYYLELSPSRAVRGSCLYCGLLIAGLLWLGQQKLLSPFSAFMLIAIGALFSGLMLLRHLRRTLRSNGTSLHAQEVWKKHWVYGRWALATSVASWLPAYIYYPLLSSFSGMGGSGELRALMNFANPMEQTQIALAMLFLPYAARLQGVNPSRGSAVGLSIRLTLVSVGVSLAYWGVVISLRIPLFHLLYSGQYMSVAPLLRIVAVGSIFWSAAYGSAIVLRAMESPASIFVAYIAATIISLLIGIPAARAFGVPGGIWGINVSDAVSFVIVLMLLKRKIGAASLLTQVASEAA